jgi:hypothetical protein
MGRLAKESVRGARSPVAFARAIAERDSDTEALAILARIDSGTTPIIARRPPDESTAQIMEVIARQLERGQPPNEEEEA